MVISETSVKVVDDSVGDGVLSALADLNKPFTVEIGGDIADAIRKANRQHETLRRHLDKQNVIDLLLLLLL